MQNNPYNDEQLCYTPVSIFYLFLLFNYFINQSGCMWDGNWRERLNFKLGHIQFITKVEHTKNHKACSACITMLNYSHPSDVCSIAIELLFNNSKH